jgi:calcineurin-like phosphoesterase
MKTDAVIERFLTQLPNRFEPEDKGPAVFNSVLIDIDKDSGQAIGIERVDREVA